MRKIISTAELWISIIALFIIIFPTFCVQSIYIVIISLLTLGIVLSNYIFKTEYKKYNKFGWIASFTLAFSFFVRWYISTEVTQHLRRINSACDRFSFVVLLCVICAVLGGLALSILFDYVKNSALRYSEKKIIPCSDESITIKEIIFIITTAFFTVTLCSKSSFLYEFNDWQDANCFLTVGRAMVNNAVLYRDIYEQKGPLLYFLHAVAALISDKNFIGVYIIEIICCSGFLFIVRKMLKFFINGNVCYYIPVVAMSIYSSVSFYHGDSAEELCLPLLAYALYVSLKSVKRRIDISKKECFIIGITSACVMWIKFTMLGFYVGIVIIPVLILLKNKKIKALLQQIGMVLTGVIAGSIPVFVYFGINDSIQELFQGYFYNNIFLYSRFNDSNEEIFAQPFLNLFSAFNQLFSNNIIVVILILIGLIWWFYSERKSLFYHMIFTILMTFVFTYIGGRSYRYYALVFGVFSFCGIIAVDKIKNMLFGQISVWKFFKNPYFSLILSMALCVLFSSNTPFMSYEKSDLPQFQFAEIINRDENATLLNYKCLDGGFYNASGILPQNKYFCKLNIQLDEMYAEQKIYFMLGMTDYIVTDRKIESDNYMLVKESSYKQGFYERDYYLYKLRE